MERDVGASTGGFTDAALKNGAQASYTRYWIITNWYKLHKNEQCRCYEGMCSVHELRRNDFTRDGRCGFD